MNKYMKKINIISFTFLLAFSFGTLNAEQVDIPEPEMLQESYLQGTRDAKREQCSKEVAPALGRECSFCHNDNVTKLTKKGDKAKFMMGNAIALGVKCNYCHAGKKQFTDKLEVAAKMLKLADMMDVECSFCHAGRDNAGNVNLTNKGMTAKTAMILQEWAKKGNKKCLKCHDKKTQFKLNAHGEKIQNSQKELLGM
jgi:nitrate/TMAO reductase-like tetraheme cytochrome c subunit